MTFDGKNLQNVQSTTSSRHQSFLLNSFTGRLPQQCSTCTAVGPFEVFNEPLHWNTEKSGKRNFPSAHKGPKMCNRITACGFCESGVKPLGLVEASHLMVGSRLKLRAFLSLGPLPLKLLFLQRDIEISDIGRGLAKWCEDTSQVLFFLFFALWLEHWISSFDWSKGDWSQLDFQKDEL